MSKPQASVASKLQFSIDRYNKLVQTTKFRTKQLETRGKSQNNAQLAMLNVMEDLEEARSLLEVEKAKDEAMLDSIGEGLIAMDNEGKVIVMNKIAEEMLGYQLGELRGNPITSLVLEDEEGRVLPRHKRPTTIALKSGDSVKVAHYFVRKDTTRFPIAITATPIKLEGKTIGLVEIIRDVTHELEVDRAKSEFVSLASHQLRTPLGIMKWYLEALESEEYFKAAPPALQEYLDEIYKNNERLLSLVRDLLSVSRIEQGRRDDTVEQVDLTVAAREIVSQMQIVIKKKKKKIKLRMEAVGKSHIFVLLDILRLREVIENLIMNAIEYTDDGGSVVVRVRKERGVVVIEVIDTGIGISRSDQKRLFTKFFRTAGAVARNVEGSGLGLYVVKSYVEGWGGKVVVNSTPGRGSTFIITLPILKRRK